MCGRERVYAWEGQSDEPSCGAAMAFTSVDLCICVCAHESECV